MSNSRLECTNHTLFQTKMGEIDTLLQAKTAENHTLWRLTYPYRLYKGLPPPPRPEAKNALQIMSLLETKKPLASKSYFV